MHGGDITSTWPPFMMDDSEGTCEGECGKLIWVIGIGADGGAGG
jgi:hypothetical protein